MRRLHSKKKVYLTGRALLFNESQYENDKLLGKPLTELPRKRKTTLAMVEIRIRELARVAIMAGY